MILAPSRDAPTARLSLKDVPTARLTTSQPSGVATVEIVIYILGVSQKGRMRYARTYILAENCRGESHSSNIIQLPKI